MGRTLPNGVDPVPSKKPAVSASFPNRGDWTWGLTFELASDIVTSMSILSMEYAGKT